ncbi:MAG TPA: hypothetical protein VH815_06235 [Acidobacteriota bacterium]
MEIKKALGPAIELPQSEFESNKTKSGSKTIQSGISSAPDSYEDTRRKLTSYVDLRTAAYQRDLSAQLSDASENKAEQITGENLIDNLSRAGIGDSHPFSEIEALRKQIAEVKKETDEKVAQDEARADAAQVAKEAKKSEPKAVITDANLKQQLLTELLNKSKKVSE